MGEGGRVRESKIKKIKTMGEGEERERERDYKNKK
jgi:hypothetical protein